MSYLIVGATKGLGLDLAYEFGKNSKNLVLISRNKEDLEKIKNDLEKKFNIKVEIFQIDFSSNDNVKKFFSNNENILKNIEGVLFPIGMMEEDDTIYNVDKKIEKLFSANFTGIAYLASKLSLFFKNKNKGVIVGFGSVASIFGRQINTGYSAAKKALETYFESLIVTNEKSEIKIQFYILGYLETRLSSNKKLFLPKGSTKKLANIVFNNLNKHGVKKYFPFWWYFIVLIIKNLPFFIMKRIIKNF